ncbi:MAG: hypothetical protein WC967_13480 [Balneolaceae bacterium]
MKQLDKLTQLKSLYDEITDSLRTCDTDKYMFCVMLHYEELVISGWLKDRESNEQYCSFSMVYSHVHPTVVATDSREVLTKDVIEMTKILTNWLNG